MMNSLLNKAILLKATADISKAFAGEVGRLSEMARSPHLPKWMRQQLKFRIMRLGEAAISDKDKAAAEHAFIRAESGM